MVSIFHTLERTYPGSLKRILDFGGLIVRVWGCFENSGKNAKTNFFKEMGLNIILETHHKYIKNDDFYLLQLLLLAYFDPSNFL